MLLRSAAPQPHFRIVCTDFLPRCRRGSDVPTPLLDLPGGGGVSRTGDATQRFNWPQEVITPRGFGMDPRHLRGGLSAAADTHTFDLKTSANAR